MLSASLNKTFLSLSFFRWRLKKPKKEPPTLPPPYQPSIGIPRTNDTADDDYESRVDVESTDSVDDDQLNYENDMNFSRKASIGSSGSDYLEPKTWVPDETEDKQQNQPTDEEFYICMEPDNQVISAVQNKKPLPHHELVYTETDIVGGKPSAVTPPKPCVGVSKQHGYVNVPSGPSSDSPSSPNDDGSTSNYYNCDQDSQLPGYANLQHMERTTTLPKYSNIPMVKPDDIERYTPKSSPKPKQMTADSKSKTEKAKRLKGDGKGASKGSSENLKKMTSIQPSSAPTRSEGGQYVNDATPPQTLPKPNRHKVKGGARGKNPSKGNHDDEYDDDDVDVDNDKDYVNVSTKLHKPKTHGCKEELNRVFQNKKVTTR